jgi:hypothetical protein
MMLPNTFTITMSTWTLQVQNVVTYTIGFDIGSDAEAKDLLARTALYGHGKFYLSQDALQLSGAFATAIDEVLAKTTSYVAPIVPVSRFEKTTAGDKIYIALFKPSLMGMWKETSRSMA